MDIIFFDQLENVKMNNMLGSESILCNCYYNNHFYLYKQPNSFNEQIAQKMTILSQISNKHLVTPKYIIYSSKNEKPIGYLLDYLNNYKSFYGLNLPKEEKIKLLKQAKEVILDMHNIGIIHTDLHLANMMYYNNDVKIIDFDSSNYQNYKSINYNFYSKKYLEEYELDESIDIFNFNIDTFSCLNNISWDCVFKYDYSVRFTEEQKKVWQKTKERKKLTYDDFLIDRY